ncbi:MAG: TetR/AcrR family transcriptional regulator [Smithella sp.]
MQEKALLEPRKMPSQDRSRKTVAAIYEAASQIFADVGYAEATTEQIAEKAGVAIGTLYNYFSGKESIIYGLWEQFEREIRTITQQVDKDIREQASFNGNTIALLLQLVLELFGFERIQNRLFITQVGLPDTVIQKRRELGLYMESVMESVLRHFVNVRVRHPKIGVHIIWATVPAVVHDYILSNSGAIKPEELIDELADMLTRYIFADE